MKTLQLANGDLVIGSGGFVTVTGAAKVRQDLGVAVREPYGTDRFHPRWGSVLVNYIGQPVGPATDMLVRSEVIRLIKNYIAVQGEQMEFDATTGSKTRFVTSEIIQAINKIEVVQERDRYHVRVSLALFSGDLVTLTTSVAA